MWQPRWESNPRMLESKSSALDQLGDGATIFLHFRYYTQTGSFFKLAAPVGFEPTNRRVKTVDHRPLGEGASTVKRMWWDQKVSNLPLLLFRQTLIHLSYDPVLYLDSFLGFQVFFRGASASRKRWCLRQDSNLRRSRLQRDALPTELQRHDVVPAAGLEPAALCLQGRRSTN